MSVATPPSLYHDGVIFCTRCRLRSIKLIHSGHIMYPKTNHEENQNLADTSCNASVESRKTSTSTICLYYLFHTVLKLYYLTLYIKQHKSLQQARVHPSLDET